MLRLLMWPVLALAAMLFATPALGQQPAGRIVAIGDLHGDHDAWRAIAAAAGLSDGKGRWTGGSATLVQMGDIVDRGPDSLKIIRDLQKLQRDAPKKGGRVIVVLGNHEAMMMTGDMRYVHPGEYAAFADGESKDRRERVYEANRDRIQAAYRERNPKITPEAIKREWMATMPLGRLEYQAAWRPDGELGKWALGNPAAVKLGDTLFVHGGMSAAFTSVPIDEINRQAEAALKAQDEAETAIINHPQGPLWYRGLIIRGDGDNATVAPIPQGATAALPIDQEIDLVLSSFGVKRIVVGHTPVREGIVEGAGGKLWRTDSAISRAYGGTLTYLEIIGDKVTPHKVQRPPGQQWGSQ